MTVHAFWNGNGLYLWGDSPRRSPTPPPTTNGHAPELTSTPLPTPTDFGNPFTIPTPDDFSPPTPPEPTTSAEPPPASDSENPKSDDPAASGGRQIPNHKSPPLPATSDTPPHPFAVSLDALRDAVGELTSDGLLAQSVRPAIAILHLPHDAAGVLPRGDEPEGITHLAPVRVPALHFTPAQVSDLLLPVAATSPDGAGESLTFFARLHRYVLSKVAQRQFYPDLDQVRAGTYAGVWRLLAHESAEIDRLTRFATAMPPVARAVTTVLRENATVLRESDRLPTLSPSGNLPGATLPEAGQIVEQFVSATADAFIRRAVSTDSFFTKVHDQAAEAAAAGDVRWLSALLGPDPVLRGGNTESNAFLAELVRNWVGKLDDGRNAQPWKLVLSLREPSLPEDYDEDEDATDGGDLEWRLILQLRAPAAPGEGPDSGELVNAEELWGDAGDPTGVFGRSVAERKAQLTTDLARAVEACPMLAPLAQSETPASMTLTTPDANAFIRNWAGALRALGFGIDLPEWAERRERGLGLMLSVRPLGEDDESTPNPLRGRLGPDGQPMEIASGHFGLDSLLEFDWQIAVGDLRLSPSEFKALSQRGSPLVRYKGQWLQIDPDAGQRAAAFLSSSGKGQMTLAQALRTAYGVAPADTGLPVIGLAGRGWIDQLLQQSPAVRVSGNITQPRAFTGTLRPYQLRGLEWMRFLDRLGLGGCLADDMGLGKTIQLISLLLSERESPEPPPTPDASALPDEKSQIAIPAAGGGNANPKEIQSLETQKPQTNPATETPSPAPHPSDSENPKSQIPNPKSPPPPTPLPPPTKPGPTLLFAPTSVVGNWLKELQRFAPQLKVLVHHGPDRLAGDDFVREASSCDVVLTSYALAHRDIKDFRRPPWHRLAVDEAQKIKNPSAAATVAIRSINAPRRIALTGTPIENHLSELWSIMELLNPGLLGTAGDFRERFAVPVEKLGDKAKAQMLRRMIQPFVLRRTKTDPAVAGDLPEKMEMKVYCNLTAEQAAYYERITAEMLGQIDAATGIRRRGLILAALTRLKQICDHPALIENDATAPAPLQSIDKRSGKVERLLEMLEEVVQEGDAALVFTQYREMGHLLEKFITERVKTSVQFLHGGTTARQRDAMIEKFQDPAGGIKVFILSLRAGGLGLNLTAANHVFHFDRWWNPAVEQQATDRAHRIGQTRKVQVHQFICVGTLEERIDKLLQDKLLLADQVVGAGDDWLTNLSTDQLRQYLSLGRDAVGEF